jgi:two-component system, OmpR family, response regulator
MPQRRKRVLCADAEEDVCEVISGLLSRRGFEVVAARSLISAHLISLGQVFDVYVIDGQFWGNVGTAFCKSIRYFDPLSPVVIFSSTAGESARREALRAGATRYVLKPDVAGLIEAVGHVTSGVPPGVVESGSGRRS